MFNYDKQQPDKRKRPLLLEEIDDVSSESSNSGSEDGEQLEQYLQECYYNTYLHYEQEARMKNHVVDVFNYNPNNLW